MIPALLKGKLSREQENMEDLLTSAVFGSLNYVHAEDGLLPFLRLAQDIRAECPLRDIPDGTKFELEFWPWLEEPNAIPCEPDVQIRLNTPDGRQFCVVVEAKFRSGKSSEADPESKCPRDQLAREYDNLTLQLRQGEKPVLIYLTADFDVPAADIAESEREFQEKRGGPAPTILWLSWRHLHDVLKSESGAVQRDLLAMLSKLGLFFFAGVSYPDTIGLRSWPLHHWQWDRFSVLNTQWRYMS